MILGLTSSELRDYATVVAASVALLVFIVNSLLLLRNRRIENLYRFFTAHNRLFSENGYIAMNIAAIESGTLVRDRSNLEMETKFHLMLLEIEQPAILANNRAVPRHTQVYMLGSYVSQLLNVMSEKERQSMFWELAIGYLESLVEDTAAYQKLTRMQRAKFWR